MAEKKTADAAAEKSIKAILDAQPKRTLHLFKDGTNYADDVVVGINGYMYQIQRGVDVEVPKSVYNVVMNSIRQDEYAAAQKRELESGANDAALR